MLHSNLSILLKTLLPAAREFYQHNLLQAYQAAKPYIENYIQNADSHLLNNLNHNVLFLFYAHVIYHPENRGN